MGKEQDLLKAAAEGDLKAVRKILAPPTSILGSFKRKDNDLPPFEMPHEKIPLAHIAIDCRDEDNNTPMSLAALNGHTELVEFLIMHVAGLNRKDKNGNTPLHFAALQGHGPVMDVLIKHGAKVNNKNNAGDTPLHFAAQYGRTLLLIKLLNAGADILEVNNIGETCLDVAARFDRRDTVSVLIDTDARILKSTKSLIDAATTGRKEVVNILLTAGMNVNAVDPTNGSTALHEAARFFRKEIAEMLLAKGADPNFRNNNGETAYSIVEDYQQNKETELYRIILQHMSKRNLTPGAPSLPPRPSSSGAPPLPSRPGRSGTGDAPPIPGRNGGPPPIPSPFGSNSTTPAAIVAAAGAPPPVPKKRSRRFPLLIPVETWTQNHDKYRSMAEGTNRATNVLLDDPAKYWVAPSGTNNWIIFDFGGEYNITGIRLETITNTMTPKNIEIQSAETFAGPYKTVMQFSVDNKGSSELTARGEFQEFTGFDIKTQFIKLILKNNYGGFHTMLKQLQFYGLEMKLESWLTEQGLQQYFINFLEADISQLSRLALMTEPEIKNIVQLAGHRKKLMMALREVKDQICLLSKLKFSIPPTHHSYDLAKLPAFEVHGDPGSEEPIAVFAHGGALIGGTAIKRLVPNGTGPSTAVFDDITLSPAGTYLLEIQAVNNPQVFCRQDKPIVVEFKLKDSGALNAVFDDLDNMLNFD